MKFATISYSDEQTTEVLKKLNIEEGEKGELKLEGVDLKCEFCNKDLIAENFGGVIPGSRHYVCKNPSCVSEYLIQIRQ